LLLAGDELDIIDQQDIHGSVPISELAHLVIPNGIDHLVGEHLG
jgi:hypothetical protein